MYTWSPTMQNILDSVIDGTQNLPSSRGLALWSNTPWARVPGGNRGKKVWTYAVIGKLKRIQQTSFQLKYRIFVRSKSRCMGCGLGNCLYRLLHDRIDSLFFIVPGNLLDERKPCARKSYFKSEYPS